MRASLRTFVFAPLLLSACGGEPENIQTKAENLSRELAEQANQIEAEASNSVGAAIAPLDNEADALLDQAANAAIPDANALVNAQ